jgi:hypothetical protein
VQIQPYVRNLKAAVNTAKDALKAVVSDEGKTFKHLIKVVSTQLVEDTAEEVRTKLQEVVPNALEPLREAASEKGQEVFGNSQQERPGDSTAANHPQQAMDDAMATIRQEAQKLVEDTNEKARKEFAAEADEIVKSQTDEVAERVKQASPEAKNAALQSIGNDIRQEVKDAVQETLENTMPNTVKEVEDIVKKQLEDDRSAEVFATQIALLSAIQEAADTVIANAEQECQKLVADVKWEVALPNTVQLLQKAIQAAVKHELPETANEVAKAAWKAYDPLRFGEIMDPLEALNEAAEKIKQAAVQRVKDIAASTTDKAFKSLPGTPHQAVEEKARKKIDEAAEKEVQEAEAKISQAVDESVLGEQMKEILRKRRADQDHVSSLLHHSEPEKKEDEGQGIRQKAVELVKKAVQAVAQKEMGSVVDEAGRQSSEKFKTIRDDLDVGPVLKMQQEANELEQAALQRIKDAAQKGLAQMIGDIDDNAVKEVLQSNGDKMVDEEVKGIEKEFTKRVGDAILDAQLDAKRKRHEASNNPFGAGFPGTAPPSF